VVSDPAPRQARQAFIAMALMQRDRHGMFPYPPGGDTPRVAADEAAPSPARTPRKGLFLRLLATPAGCPKFIL
jgi:hypothetical protein